MGPLSLPTTLIRHFSPEFNGPTAWLLSRGHNYAQLQHQKFKSVVLSRICCITSVATAAIECLVHAASFVGTFAMIGVKRCVWITLIVSAYIAGGLYWLIYGNAFRTDLGYWAKFFALNVVLLLRHPRTMWNHFTVWAGLGYQHAASMIHITSLAITIERKMSRYFSSHHLKHHAKQTMQLFSYILSGIPAGLWHPETSTKLALDWELGPPKPPSLAERIWQRVPSPYPWLGWGIAKGLLFAGNYGDKLLIVFAALFLYNSPSEIRWLMGLSRSVVSSVTTYLAGHPPITPEDFERLVEEVKRIADGERMCPVDRGE